MRPLNALNIEYIGINEPPRILSIWNVQLQQQIIIATCRMQFRKGFPQCNFVSHFIGLPRLATDLNKNSIHDATLPKVFRFMLYPNTKNVNNKHGG